MKLRTFIFPCFWVLAFPAFASAQELEPRAFSPNPVGTNFVSVVYTYSIGGIIFDPSIPITDVAAKLNIPAVGLGRTFGLLGRQWLVTAVLPYGQGDIRGNVMEQQALITRSGLADLRVKVSANLRGSPAQSPSEFAKASHRSLIVSTGLTVQAPTGQYDATRLINLGTNRWAFKPEIGVSYPLSKFYLDSYAGIWLFTKNSNFYPSNAVRTQSSLTTLQAHCSYVIRPRLWLAIGGTWYGGGAASVNEGPEIGRQSSSRLGAMFSIPVTKKQSLKIAYSSGVAARVGTNFRSISVAWQLFWFDREKGKNNQP